MRRDQIGELFYISHVENVASILRTGILSHNRAVRVAHRVVDLEAVQDIRSNIRVSRTRMLHDHANLYVCGRNAMMYHVVGHNPIDQACLLRVSPDVLDLEDVVVADGNAARQYQTRFWEPIAGIAALDFDQVHAEYWTQHPTAAECYEHKRIKQAEVLVPDWVDPQYIIGAYVPTGGAAAAVEAALGPWGRPVVRAAYPFFHRTVGTK